MSCDRPTEAFVLGLNKRQRSPLQTRAGCASTIVESFGRSLFEQGIISRNFGYPFGFPFPFRYGRCDNFDIVELGLFALFSN
jgi:hypothetical protein